MIGKFFLRGKCTEKVINVGGVVNVCGWERERIFNSLPYFGKIRNTDFLFWQFSSSKRSSFKFSTKFLKIYCLSSSYKFHSNYKNHCFVYLAVSRLIHATVETPLFILCHKNYFLDKY